MLTHDTHHHHHIDRGILPVHLSICQSVLYQTETA